MVDTDFYDPDRIKLLTDLKTALNMTVSSTIWACLWLSDIDKLTQLIDWAQKRPYMIRLSLTGPNIGRNIVRQCEFINIYTFS